MTEQEATALQARIAERAARFWLCAQCAVLTQHGCVHYCVGQPLGPGRIIALGTIEQAEIGLTDQGALVVQLIVQLAQRQVAAMAAEPAYLRHLLAVCRATMVSALQGKVVLVDHSPLAVHRLFSLDAAVPPLDLEDPTRSFVPTEEPSTLVETVPPPEAPRPQPRRPQKRSKGTTP